MEQQTLSQQTTVEGSSVLKPCPNCQASPASAEDVFCAECGTRLISVAPDPVEVPITISEEPQPPVVEDVQPLVVEQDITVNDVTVQETVEEIPQREVLKTNEPVQDIQPEAPVVNQVISSAEQVPVPPAAETVIPPVQPQVSTPPVQPQHVQLSQPSGKKRSAGKIIFRIVLILLIIVLVGGGTGGFLIYNGNVSRDAMGKFVPKSVLDMIPSAKGVKSTTATRYYVVYCSGQFEKVGKKKGKKTEMEKKAVISDVFTDLDISSNTEDAAEVAFRNIGNEKIEKFSRFKKFFVIGFTSNSEAFDERERIIRDLKSKGYKPEFISVKK